MKIVGKMDTEGWWTSEADSMFLIEKGACAVVKDIAFHLEGEIGQVPKCVANAFVQRHAPP